MKVIRMNGKNFAKFQCEKTQFGYILRIPGSCCGYNDFTENNKIQYKDDEVSKIDVMSSSTQHSCGTVQIRQKIAEHNQKHSGKPVQILEKIAEARKLTCY